MATPDQTSRLANNQRDLHAMRLREDLLKATAELDVLNALPHDDARIASLQLRIDELRKDLMAEMKSTDKLE